MKEQTIRIVLEVVVPAGCSVRVLTSGAAESPPAAPPSGAGTPAEAVGALERYGVSAPLELLHAYSPDRIIEVVRYVEGRGQQVKSPAAMILSCLKRGYTVRKAFLSGAGGGG